MNHRRAHHDPLQTSSTGLGSQRPAPFAGLGNAARAEALRARQEGGPSGQQVPSFSGQDQLLADLRGEPLVATTVEAFQKTNLYTAMVRLVETEGWDEEYAASWLGQAVVETGKKNLEKLDVVEKGSGAGRGMFQYTDDRRAPYDRARAQALRQGQDVNDINWQIDYALNTDNSYVNLDALQAGLTDPKQNYRFEPRWGTASGVSPTGRRYKDKFPDANSLVAAYKNDRVAGYSRALTGEYTRAGEPHLDRRIAASKRILEMYRKTKREATKPKVA